MKNIKSKYWIRKWQKKNWEDFETLENGHIFDTSVSNHRQMQDRIGDIIFWYRTDKGFEGIYFVTEVVAQPKQDDAYNTSWSMSLRVIKTLAKNPVVITQKWFTKTMDKINQMQQGGGIYNLLESEQPEKIWDSVIKNEKTVWEKENYIIDQTLIKTIEDIKQKHIDDGTMFNPFVDMNFVKHEVRHLSFLANLLNPHGSHHQGTLFLKLFIDEILLYNSQNNNQYLQTFCDNENIYVQTEKSIPNGRIDIWIENDDYIIAIEGKTESTDSENQLNKYDEYLQKQDKPYLLMYLTKFGEEPNNDYPETLQLVSFKNDIMTFISNSFNIEKLSDTIYLSLNAYYDALIIYLFEFSNSWEYELNLIYEITEDEESYKKYEKVKDFYYYDKHRYKYGVVEDIANIFEKSKAFLEREFLLNLSNTLDDSLEKEGFYFSQNSNILVKDFEDNPNIDINYDIDTIFEKRKNRTFNYTQHHIDDIREKTGHNLIYINELSDEYIVLTILNDYYGLNTYFNHFKNEKCINYFSGQHIPLLPFDIFYASNISKLLNEDYTLKLIEECRVKLLDGLKQVTI